MLTSPCLHRTALVLGLVLGLTLGPARAAEPSNLPRLSEALSDAVAGGEIAGGVAMVVRDGRTLHRQAVGLADVAANRAAQVNDLYWIASMTKPITAAAIMMLVDEGKLSIDDPLAKHLPEFASPWTIASQSDDRMVLERPKTTVTLRHLLTHTSGLADVPVPREGTPLSEWVSGTARVPLKFEPGTRWAYSNAGMNALGRVVEVVSGMSFERFVEQRLFTPLGMRDTTFHPAGAQLERVVKAYSIDVANRKLKEVQHPFINGPVGSPTRIVAPAGGLYSTADDMLRFYQMVLAGGTCEGKRILSEQAVREMTRTQTGELETGFVEGMSFGLGFAVVKAPQARSAMFSAGTFGHGGAYGTHSWADPKRGLIIIVMTQRSNFTPHADGAELRQKLFGSIVDSLDR